MFVDVGGEKRRRSIRMQEHAHRRLRLPKVEQLYGAVTETGHRVVVTRGQAEHTAGHLGRVVLVQLFVHVPNANERGVARAQQRLVTFVPLGDQARLKVRLALLRVAVGRERSDQLTLAKRDQIRSPQTNHSVISSG